jgi:hypothetical protein
MTLMQSLFDFSSISSITITVCSQLEGVGNTQVQHYDFLYT